MYTHYVEVGAGGGRGSDIVRHSGGIVGGERVGEGQGARDGGVVRHRDRGVGNKRWGDGGKTVIVQQFGSREKRSFHRSQPSRVGLFMELRV